MAKIVNDSSPGGVDITSWCMLGDSANINDVSAVHPALMCELQDPSCTILIRAGTLYYDCNYVATRYFIIFNTTGDTHSIELPYKYEESHYAMYQALSNMLIGTIWCKNDDKIVILEDGPHYLRGYLAGMSTKITSTALYATLGIETLGCQEPNCTIPESALPASERELVGNSTMGELIEELSRYLTLSFFSNDLLLSTNGTNVTVHQTLPCNVYSYAWRNLVLAYAFSV